MLLLLFLSLESQLSVFSFRGTLDASYFSLTYPSSFRPGIWQILKVAWIQYLAVLVIFVVVFDKIKQFVFSQQLVETVPSKVHTD